MSSQPSAPDHDARTASDPEVGTPAPHIQATGSSVGDQGTLTQLNVAAVQPLIRNMEIVDLRWLLGQCFPVEAHRPLQTLMMDALHACARSGTGPESAAVYERWRQAQPQEFVWPTAEMIGASHRRWNTALRAAGLDPIVSETRRRRDGEGTGRRQRKAEPRAQGVTHSRHYAFAGVKFTREHALGAMRAFLNDPEIATGVKAATSGNYEAWVHAQLTDGATPAYPRRYETITRVLGPWRAAVAAVGFVADDHWRTVQQNADERRAESIRTLLRTLEPDAAKRARLTRAQYEQLARDYAAASPTAERPVFPHTIQRFYGSWQAAIRDSLGEPGTGSVPDRAAVRDAAAQAKAARAEKSALSTEDRAALARREREASVKRRRQEQAQIPLEQRAAQAPEMISDLRAAEPDPHRRLKLTEYRYRKWVKRTRAEHPDDPPPTSGFRITQHFGGWADAIKASM